MIAFDISETVIRLLIAAVLGGLVGLEREHRGTAAGLRTLMLVSVGASLITLTALQTAENPALMTGGIITGIGFLGAGAILRDKEGVHGTTTAASIWVTAMIGMAVGYGYYLDAAITTIIVLAVLIVLYQYEKRYIRNHGIKHSRPRP